MDCGATTCRPRHTCVPPPPRRPPCQRGSGRGQTPTGCNNRKSTGSPERRGKYQNNAIRSIWPRPFYNSRVVTKFHQLHSRENNWGWSSISKCLDAPLGSLPGMGERLGESGPQPTVGRPRCFNAGTGVWDVEWRWGRGRTNVAACSGAMGEDSIKYNYEPYNNTCDLEREFRPIPHRERNGGVAWQSERQEWLVRLTVGGGWGRGSVSPSRRGSTALQDRMDFSYLSVENS